jgi:putative FmdB family regulatory protein
VPTYDYECTRCGFVFEEFQSITAPPRQRCPHCRGKVERLIAGGAGILFRGSGFYVNDSRKQASSSASQKDKQAEAAPDTTGDAAGAKAGGKTGEKIDAAGSGKPGDGSTPKA